MSPRLRGAASVLSGLLCAGSMPPFDLWALALVCWVPLLLAIEGVALRTALLLGLCQGLAANAPTHAFLIGGLERGTDLTAAGIGTAYALVVAGQALRSGVVAALVVTAQARGASALVALPLALVACELAWPMLFPWTTANLVHARPELAQLAELGGMPLVTAVIALTNALLAASLRRDAARGRGRAAAVAVLLVGVLFVHGSLRAAATDAAFRDAERVRVGVVQGAVDKRAGPDAAVTHRELSLELLRSERALDLLVWPETAVPYPTQVPRLARFLRNHALGDPRAQGADARIHVPLLTGMVLSEPDPDTTDGLRHANAAVLASPTGAVLGVYEKQTLLPLAERRIGFPLLGARGPGWSPARPFDAKRPPAPLVLDDLRLQASICYEDVLAGPFREAVREGRPHALVNLTSDSWFQGSAAARLHLALAKMRAIEHRRELLRATNDGETVVVDARGRVVWRLPPDQRAAGATRLRLARGQTPYTKLGDAPAWVALATGWGWLLWRRLRN